MTARWSSILPILFASLAVGQASTPQQRVLVLDGYQGGWSVSATESVSEDAVMEDAVKSEKKEAELVMPQLDLIRSERNASLARNQGRIPTTDQAQIQTWAAELNRKKPDSFEAHMANYYSDFPAVKAFQELDLAVAKDRERVELVGPRLLNALRMDNTSELTSLSKDMRDRGGIAPPLYLVASDMLASVEPRAVFFAAGDMDIFPLLVEQFAHDKRKDLLLVDVRLLQDPSYRLRVWEHAQASGKLAGEARFIQDLAHATSRPVYVSMALGEKELAPLKEKLYTTGLAMRYSEKPIDNIPLLEARWGTFRKPTDAGPLSKNYLLPGSVLLLHYRAIGDEPRAARLEYELRELAKRLGATNALYRSGVLAH